ncbi:MAG TPA: hypothetical protein VGF77_07055 [Allosphingosinicella sp.]
MIGTLGRNRERIDVDYGFPQPAGRNEPDVTSGAQGAFIPSDSAGLTIARPSHFSRDGLPIQQRERE